MLKFAVDTGNFKEIKCPAAATDKCKRVLHGKDVEALADRETYKKCAGASVPMLVLRYADRQQVRQVHDGRTTEI
jgi:hypothetical protein